MARIHGKRGQVLMDETGGSPYTPTEVADINAFTLNLSTDRADSTGFGDANKQQVAGLPSYSGTISGFWNSVTSPRLFDVILGGLPVDLRLMPNRDESTFYFEGLANLDGSLNVSATGAVTFAGNWDAAGNWAMFP